MIVDKGLYVNGQREAGPEDISELVDIARKKDGYVWIGLAEPTQQEFDTIVGELNFHPLAVEDAVLAKQRPKMEDYDGLTFFVITSKKYDFFQKLTPVTLQQLPLQQLLLQQLPLRQLLLQQLPLQQLPLQQLPQ